MLYIEAGYAILQSVLLDEAQSPHLLLYATSLSISVSITSLLSAKSFVDKQELYAKLAGENANFGAVADNAREKNNNYANDSVISLHAGMDSGAIRTANGGRNIVVKLDGKTSLRYFLYLFHYFHSVLSLTKTVTI